MRHSNQPETQNRRNFLLQGLGISVGMFGVEKLGPMTQMLPQGIAQLVLMAAAQDDHTEHLLWAIENGAKINTIAGFPSLFPTSALHIAVEWNSLSCIGLLLRSGADANLSNDSYVPLMGVRSIESAELLIRFGADPNASNYKSVLQHVGPGEIANFLISKGAIQ